MKKIKKHSKDRDFSKQKAIVVAGIVSLLLACIGYGVALAIQEAVLGDYAKSEVYVLKENVLRGETVTESDFKKELIDTKMIPEDAITDLKAVANSYYICNLTKNNVLCSDFVADKPPVSCVELEIACENAVGGEIRPSDYITVYIESGEVVNSYEGLYVSSVHDSNGAAIEVGDTKSSATRINVLTSEATANEIVANLSTGNISISRYTNYEEKK